MRESFEEYKKTIEKALISAPFFYSGDVINQKEEISYQEIKESHLVSPDFIVNVFKEIYKESIKNFFSKQHNFVYLEHIDELSRPVSSYDIYIKSTSEKLNPKFILSTLKNYQNMGSGYFQDKTRYLPDFFYPIKYDAYPSNTTSYYTPTGGYFNVPEDENSYTNFWTIDKPIQSLLFILQNMRYEIAKNEIGYKHTMIFPIYECQYNTLNVRVRDMKQYRDGILDKILN